MALMVKIKPSLHQKHGPIRAIVTVELRLRGLAESSVPQPGAGDCSTIRPLANPGTILRLTVAYRLPRLWFSAAGQTNRFFVG